MATTKLILRDLRLSCIIGIDAAERHVRQVVLVDADLSLRAADGENDQKPDADYAVIAAQIRAFAADSSYGLLETFAERLAAELLAVPAVAAVRLSCRKPRPLADVGAAGVEIERP